MKALGLALIAGLLFALALPPYNQEWLGWFAFAPLLVAADGRRPLEAVGLGLIAGLTGGLVHARWHSDSSAMLLAYLPFLWLAVFFGVVALAGRTARAHHWSGLPWIGFVACSGVTAEWLTTFSPLPLNVALCQYRDLPLIQLASITGIWGVSFLIWLVNATLALAALERRLRPQTLGIAAILLLGTLLWGRTRLLPKAPNTPILRVAAIQDYSPGEAGNVAGVLAETKDTDDDPDREAMTRQAATEGAKLVVSSEESLGSAFQPDDPQDGTHLLAQQTHTALVVGFSDDHTPHPHNCAALVLPDGRTAGVYHKTHLFLGERQMVTPGSATPTFASPLGRVGMEICFDSLYTDITRGLARHGAQIVAMPNFDPPTPQGVLHELHSALLPLRAVENRVPFVRSDSNGVSQIIQADGRVIAQAPLWKPAVLIADVPLSDGHGTLFTRWGDWFAYLCITGTLVDVFSLRRPLRPAGGEQNRPRARLPSVAVEQPS
jgi:apolipoprotein N-acyltransferase